MVYKIELTYRFKQKAKSEALVRTFKNSLKLSLLSLRSLEYLNWPAKNLKKHFISMICTPEPTIQSCDTGKRVTYYDSCQLFITLDVRYLVKCLGLLS